MNATTRSVFVPAPLHPEALEGRFDARHPAMVALGGLAFGCLVVGVAAGQGVVPGLVAVLAVAAILWAVSHPVSGALAIVAIVPAISGMRRGLPVPGLRLGELVAVGFSVLLLTTAKSGQWRRWRAFDWLALGYVIATFGLGWLDTQLRGDTLSSEDLGQLVGPLQFFLLYRAVLVALPDRADRSRAVDWLLIGSIPVSLLTLAQALHLPGIQEVLVTFTGQDYSDRLTWAIPRANGPFPHWTMLAGYTSAIVVICSALLLGGVGGRRRRIALIALVPAVISLVLTVTIAPMLGAVAGALALAVWYRRAGRTLAYGAVVCALLLFLFAPLLSRRADDQFVSQSSSSAQTSIVPATVANRIGFWTEQYLPALEGRFLTGYGPQIPPEITWKYTESVYITMLLRGGVPLLALYTALMWALALLALDVGRRRRTEETATEQALARATFVLIAVLAVTQLIAPYFTTTGLPHVWWIAAALVVAGAGGRAGPGVALQRERRPLRLALGKVGALWSEAGVVLAGNVLARGLGFMFPVVLAHFVTKGQFGTVYFFIGTGFFVGELVLTGFPTAMTRFIAAEGWRGPWLAASVAGGIPLLIASIAVGELLADVAGAPAGLMSVVVCGLTIDAYYFGLLRGLRRFPLLATYRVSAALAQLVLLLGAIAAGLDTVAVVVAIYSFVYLIPIAVIELASQPLRRALRRATRPSRAQVRKLARFAVPALISGTAYAALTQGDVFFVELLAPHALADYAAARSLAQPVMLVPWAIAIVMLPAVASAEPGERWRMLTRALAVSLALGTVLLGVYLVAGAELVELVLPDSYSRVTESLPILVGALGGMGMYTVLSQWWMGIGRPGPPAIALTAGAGVGIGLQYGLTPDHGAVGAATAAVGGVACALVILGVATLRTHARARDTQPGASS